MAISIYLDIASATLALAAAYFWFASAGQLPAMKTYWDGTPPHDPFLMATRRAARNNQIAAALSGLAAICMASSTLLKL